MSKEEIFNWSEKVKIVPKIPQTLIRRIEFFKLATDEELFYVQYSNITEGMEILQFEAMGKKNLMKIIYIKEFQSGFNVLCSQYGFMNRVFMMRFKTFNKLKYVQKSRLFLFFLQVCCILKSFFFVCVTRKRRDIKMLLCLSDTVRIKFNIVSNNDLGGMQKCYFSALERKYPFWTNLVQKSKIVSLTKICYLV